MTNSVSPPTAGLTEHIDNLSGLALFGKTAFFLLILIGLILICGWLLKRVSTNRNSAHPVRIVGTTSLGQRERIVIIEVKEQWLVLGVTANQISKLHEIPAPPATSTELDKNAVDSNFSTRFTHALIEQIKNRG